MTPASGQGGLERVDQTSASVAGSVTLAVVVGMTFFAWHYGSRISDQGAILFLANGISLGAAVSAAYILFMKARAVADQGLTWLAWAYGSAAAGIAIQTVALQDLLSPGEGSHLSPSAIAFAFLVFQTAFPTAALLRLRRVSWERWGGIAMSLSIAALGYAAWQGSPMPPLVVEGDRFTPLFTGLLLMLAAYSAAVVAAVLKDAVGNLEWTDVWITLSIVTGIAAVVLRALSATRFDDLYWASVSTRTLQFVIPAIGFMTSLGTLFRALEAHQRGLTERFRSEIHRLRNVAQVNISNQYLEQEMTERIDGAIRDQKIRAVFQPIVELTSGKIMGAEALTRFDVERATSPQEWFETAAKVGRAIELESAAVAEAIKSFSELPEDCYLSLNASPMTIVSPGFADLLSGLPLDRVVLEITEHAFIDDYTTLNGTLDRLRRQGVRLAVDDAGAGFASFRHIVRLNPDIIKLDVSLIRGIVDDPVRQSLATALVGFAQDLRATVVAEGIEEAAELELLVALGIGCCGQGYYLGRPGPLPLRSGLQREMEPAGRLATA